jgi:hypothetical protein
MVEKILQKKNGIRKCYKYVITINRFKVKRFKNCILQPFIDTVFSQKSFFSSLVG